MTKIPRPEFPNPQFERKNWINLNGEWDFEFDFGKSKLYSGILDREKWENVITVPFCPESELSGVGYKDFIPAVWYRKSIDITAEQLKGRVMLHFGAVDYSCVVYVNGGECGSHKGGYTSFCIDITAKLVAGKNTVCVYAQDDVRCPLVPRGKQSEELKSHNCDYTRTTGIWQTVWLEFVPKNYIKSITVFPDAANCSVSISAELCGNGSFTAQASFGGESMGSFTKNAAGFVSGEIRLSQSHLWQPGKGGLYDLRLTFGDDEVFSYFGLRDLCVDGYKFLINGKSVFQRLVLDQGFYPDGIYTAATDEALEKDILLSFAVGFNGARLHQKVFESRFLYHCDRLGYIVWGEYPNWGVDYSNPAAVEAILPEWISEVKRDINHPSIVGWCPFNETWDYAGRKQNDELLRVVYRMTKAVDPSRPRIDTSGNYHVETDIYDVHNYEQDPEVFKSQYESLASDGILFDPVNRRCEMQYEGGAVFVSEYGGIQWSPANANGAWGYGNAPKSEEELIKRYKGLTDVLLDNERMFGFCYTQLYDIEQEQNGLYFYDRTPKFDTAVFKAINERKAAIED